MKTVKYAMASLAAAALMSPCLPAATRIPGESGGMRFVGGGTFRQTGSVNWTGGTVVETGTRVSVPSGAVKDSLLASGFSVAVTDAWLDGGEDASLVVFEQSGQRFAPSDLGKVFLAGGSPAQAELAIDRRELRLGAPAVHSATMNANASVSSLFGSVASSLTTRDVLSVKAQQSKTLTIDSAVDVMAVKFNVPSGKTLTLAGAANLKAARIRVFGGGVLRIDGAFGALGGISVEAGSCVEVQNAADKDAVLGAGLAVLAPTKLFSLTGDVPLFKIIGNGQMGAGDVAKVEFPGLASSSARLSSDSKAINIGLVKYTAAASGGMKGILSLPWSPELPGALSAWDMLVVNVSADTRLNIDIPVSAFAAKFAVASGSTLTLSGVGVASPYLQVDGGRVVATVSSKFGSLLGNGTFAAAPGVSSCEFADLSGFTGTLDAGDGSSVWRVKLEGGAQLDAAGHVVSVLPEATAAVASSSHPFASGEGMTLKGALKVCDGATFFARESGSSSGGELLVEPGANLRFRFTESAVAPTVQQTSGQSLIQ